MIISLVVIMIDQLKVSHALLWALQIYYVVIWINHVSYKCKQVGKYTYALRFYAYLGSHYYQ